MARKLSPVTSRLLSLLVAAGAAFGATRLSAQSPVQAGEAANVIENPFASQPLAQPKRQAPPQSSVASESKTPPRRAVSYQNPFSGASKLPPVDTSLRPGPVSRWRRPTISGTETSSIKSAVLSRPPGEPDRPGWDVLPPAEDLRQQVAARGIDVDPTFFARLTTPANTIHFTPKPLTQPTWLTEFDESISRDATPIPIDPALFDSPLNGEELLNHTGVQLVTAVSQPPGLVSNAFAIDPVGAPSATEVSPDVISACADTPEDWMGQAQQAATSANSPEELSSVIEMCNRGLRGGPDGKLSNSLRRLAAWAHNRRGEMRADEDHAEDALRDFQAAIALDSNCSLAIHNRAVTLAQQNQFDAALRDFNRVIELNPGLAVAYRNRAELLVATDRMEEAIADYSQAIESLPDDSQLYRGRAHAYQRLGQNSTAAADYNRAIGIAPNDPETLTLRGNLASEQGNYRQAVRDFRHALSIDPSLAEAHRGLAWVSATCPNSNYRNAEEAVAAAEQAAKLGPTNDFVFLDTLAAAWASAGKFDKAINIQEQAISLAPPEIAASLEHRLSLYRHGQPFRSSPPGEGSR